MKRARHLGFTLVEMMVVVALLAILAAIAIPAYRKYIASARKSEIYAMFGEIRNKEEAYRAEFSRYMHTDATQSETTFYPTSVNGNPQDWNPPGTTFWGSNGLGVNPGRRQMYCMYNVVENTANNNTALGTRGTAWFGGTPTTTWWYANAVCDNDHDSTTNAHFLTSMDNTSVYEETPQN